MSKTTVTKPNEKTPETSTEETVKISYENGSAVVRSDKHKANFLVYKARDNTPFFSIRTDVGPLPKYLQGKYTTLPKAVAAIQDHIRNASMTFAAKSEKLAEYRNASKS